jgi:hypothetical protein
LFRDYPVRSLAERIAGEGVLDAAKIGAVANLLELEGKRGRTGPLMRTG